MTNTAGRPYRVSIMGNEHFALIPASYVFLHRAGRVLLQLRQNTGYLDGCWVAGAAGHLEPGETVQECAVREAREELGIGIAAASLVPLTVMHRTNGTSSPREQRVDWFFLTEHWDGDPDILEPHKCAGLQWFDLSRLPASISPYEYWVLSGYAAATLPILSSYGFDRPLV